MPIANPTTWRWPDSTFGPQVKVPFNDNQQYPDCGPSIRVYTLENILYGLEEVITPLLQGGVQTFQQVTFDTTYVALASATCEEVLVVNNTGVTVRGSKDAGTTYFDIPDKAGFCFKNLTNANQLSLKRASGSGSVTVNCALYNV
jgi:hypothetical protein